MSKNNENRRKMPRKLPYLIALIAIPVIALLVWLGICIGNGIKYDKQFAEKLKTELSIESAKTEKFSDVAYLDLDLHATTYKKATESATGSLSFSFTFKTLENPTDTFEQISGMVVAVNQGACYVSSKYSMSSIPLSRWNL